MQVEMWTLDRIKPYENNPRINDDAVADVVQSINEFGFRQPIVVDTAGVIIVGHTRFKAAKVLNLTEVPVHVATDMEPEAVRAYRIADNRTGENAEWDFELLPLVSQKLMPEQHYSLQPSQEINQTTYLREESNLNFLRLLVF